MTAPLPRVADHDPRPREDGRLWLGTSWKMTKTLAEARAYVNDLALEPVPDGVEVFVLPPLTALHAVLDARPAGFPLRVGAQNAHWAPDGPVTGEVSMHQLRDAGAEIVEIGHSDRRSQFGETDQIVAAKVTAALDQHLVPLVCVGEPWSVRAEGRAAAYVGEQVRTALSGFAPGDVERVLVAYEPVWAIGDSGRAAAPVDVVGVLDRMRSVVAKLGPGARLRGLLYGGSVNAANAEALLDLDDLDGLFVGRAAWTVHDFAELLRICGRIAPRRIRTTTPVDPTSSRRSR
jgi:L-erythrulose 1-phosphate isomerase